MVKSIMKRYHKYKYQEVISLSTQQQSHYKLSATELLPISPLIKVDLSIWAIYYFSPYILCTAYSTNVENNIQAEAYFVLYKQRIGIYNGRNQPLQ